MKTYIVPDSVVAEVYGADLPMTATPAVHAVRVLPVVFEDERVANLEREVDELNDLARRAQRREVAAVRRCEALTEALQAITGAVEEGCNSEAAYLTGLARDARHALEAA